MKSETSKIIRVLLLGGLGAYLLHKILSGTVYYYINERFVWLVALGGALFLLLAYAIWAENRRAPAHLHVHDGHEYQGHAHHGHKVSRWPFLIMALPLLLGVLIPSRPLDTSALTTRGVSNNAAVSAAQSQDVALERPADERNVLDWVRAFNFSSDPGEFEGAQADVIGFVYHDPRLAEDQMLVGRFAVSCCVADAFAIGVIVQSEEAADWASNTWVHVKGRITVGSLGGEPSPVILPESIVQVAVPPQPYLFP